MRRVVVTGIGAVTPFGSGVEIFWNGLLSCKSTASAITRFDTTQHKVHFACMLNDFQPHPDIDPRELRRMDRYCHYAMSGAIEAVNMSGLADKCDPDSVGVIIASGIGGIEELENQHERMLTRGPSRVSPLMIPMMILDMASGLVAIHYGFANANYGIASACASGAHAIGEAFRTIKYGHADAMVTGGAEAGITRLSVAAFGNMGALSTRNDSPETASRPFDLTRDGFVMGEGAGVLVLEELEHAKRRGATILAELTGYGHTADAHHITSPAPGGQGAIKAMKQAIAESGKTPDDVDYINAHGTSTPPNDSAESQAINTLFCRKLPVSSTKSMTGHLLGASGAIELIATIMTINSGVIHPTINYTEPDPECDIDCVPNSPRDQKVEFAISNSFGFGGHNASLAVAAYKD